LVAKGYRPVDRDQQFLIPPDMRDRLGADHPVWTVIDIIDRIDTTAFHKSAKTGGAGRAGYHPDMLLTLLVWAWSRGERSSRRIERLCTEDVAYRVICAQDIPDHVTIARFRKTHATACEDLFTQVLLLAAGLGLGRLETIALDSVKIASNAGTSANRTGVGAGAGRCVRGGGDGVSVADRGGNHDLPQAFSYCGDSVRACQAQFEFSAVHRTRVGSCSW
jgi:transposase